MAELFILKHLHLDGTNTEYVKKADYDELLKQAERMAELIVFMHGGRIEGCPCQHCAILTDWLKFREGK